MSTFHQKEMAKLLRVIALYESALGFIEHYPIHGDNPGLQYCKDKAAEAREKKQDAIDGKIYAQIDGSCNK
jgi:hypothetical protein